MRFCQVGFGDITPITVQGRFVVAFSILAGVAVFPYQFSRLAEVRTRQKHDIREKWKKY